MATCDNCQLAKVTFWHYCNNNSIGIAFCNAMYLGCRCLYLCMCYIIIKKLYCSQCYIIIGISCVHRPCRISVLYTVHICRILEVPVQIHSAVCSILSQYTLLNPIADSTVFWVWRKNIIHTSFSEGSMYYIVF